MASAAVRRLRRGEIPRCQVFAVILSLILPRCMVLLLASLAVIETVSLAIPIPAPAGAVALIAPGCWLILAGIGAWRSVRQARTVPCCAHCAAARAARPGPGGEDADITAGWALFEIGQAAANNP